MRYLAAVRRGEQPMPGPGLLWRRFRDNVLRDPVPASAPQPAWAHTALARHHLELFHFYRPPATFPVACTLVRESESFATVFRPFGWETHPFLWPETAREPDAGWGRWTTVPPRVHWLPTDHDAIIKAAAAPALAAVLASTLKDSPTSQARAVPQESLVP
jgi:thioesterase domain-containing protein